MIRICIYQGSGIDKVCKCTLYEGPPLFSLLFVCIAFFPMFYPLYVQIIINIYVCDQNILFASDKQTTNEVAFGQMHSPTRFLYENSGCN